MIIKINTGNNDQRVDTAFAKIHGYKPLLDDDTPNPQTPTQFTQSIIENFVNQTVETHEINDSVNQARATAIAIFDKGVIIATTDNKIVVM